MLLCLVVYLGIVEGGKNWCIDWRETHLEFFFGEYLEEASLGDTCSCRIAVFVKIDNSNTGWYGLGIGTYYVLEFDIAARKLLEKRVL